MTKKLYGTKFVSLFEVRDEVTDKSYFVASRQADYQPKHRMEADAVTMFVFSPDMQRVLLVEEYRPAIAHKVLSTPAGLADKPGEDPHDVAFRELVEETGYYDVEQIVTLPPTYSSIGLTNERVQPVFIKLKSLKKHDPREIDQKRITAFWCNKEDAETIAFCDGRVTARCQLGMLLFASGYVEKLFADDSKTAKVLDKAMGESKTEELSKAEEVEHQKTPISVFDIDGTIYKGNLAVDFFWHLVDEKQIDQDYYLPYLLLREKVDRRKKTYDEYLDAVCNGLTSWLHGKELSYIEKHVETFLFKGMIGVSIYPTYAIKAVADDLANLLKNKEEVFFVTGSPDFLAKPFIKMLLRHYNIPFTTVENNFVTTEYNIENGIIYEMSRKCWSREHKEELIEHLHEKYIIKSAYGNSGADLALMEEATDKIVLVNPTYTLSRGAGLLSAKEKLVHLTKRGQVYTRNLLG